MNRLNFEDALSELQQSPARRSEWAILQQAILRVFERINLIFERQCFELDQQRFTHDRHRTVAAFLARFDAIFTLNQDLLLEIHYFDKHGERNDRRWTAGASIPGMQPVGQADSTKPWSARQWVPSGGCPLEQGKQTYVKLHGSINWRQSEGSDALMIMGGEKSAAINDVPVLKEHHRHLSSHLNRPGTHLTVVGYSFRDPHINDRLKEAVNEYGLKIYLIDPKGAALAYGLRPLGPNRIGYGPTDIESWFQKGLHSASVIPIRNLLIDESVDREVLSEFLSS